MKELERDEKIIDDVLENLFVQKYNAIFTDNIANAVYAKILSSAVTESMHTGLIRKVRAKLRSSSRPQGKYVPAGSVQSGNLLQRLQNTKKYLGNRSGELWIMKNGSYDSQQRHTGN